MSANDKGFFTSLSKILLAAEPAELIQRESASVAVIIRNLGRAEVMLIRRAEREGDPWSGNVAFPGGHVEHADASFKDTAVREASEEVGINLRSASRFLGYMRPFNPRNRQVTVVPSVFSLTNDVPVKLNPEATSYTWVPLAALSKTEHVSTHISKRDGVDVSFPSFVYNGYVVWGLTERILSAIIDARYATGSGRRLSSP